MWGINEIEDVACHDF